jgi:small-conductance mechanosensitive channel
MAMLLFVALGLTNALRWRVMKSQALDDSLKLAITKLGKFLLLTTAVLVAMIASGIDLTALAVFGGALGVGLGLGLQRVVSNFVSGVILAFEGSIRLGDVITIGKTYGAVTGMHARHIVVHTRDGLDILVPNETLLTGEITNWSHGDRNVRLGLPVQISYRNDPEAAIALLERVALTHPRVLPEPVPAGQLKGFGENGIDLELRIWVNDPEHGTGNVRSEINRAIWKAFQEAGITIPCPQRELHIREMPGAAKSRSPDI